MTVAMAAVSPEATLSSNFSLAASFSMIFDTILLDEPSYKAKSTCREEIVKLSSMGIIKTISRGFSASFS